MAVRSATAALRRRRGAGSAGLVFLGLSVLAAALIFSRKSGAVVEEPQKPIVVAQFDTIDLPVPAAAVPSGTKVRNIHFRSVTFPKQQVPKGALVDLSPMLEYVSVSPLPANLPVFSENFSGSASTSNPVTERIPQGMRAMSIKVDATSAVEGWAGSGALVDVLLVAKDRTSVIAEKVKILSAERSVSPVDGNSAPSVPSTVTLLVTQEQCLAINTSIPLGKIAFALRNVGDEAQWNGTSYTADQLKGGPSIRDERRPITGYAVMKGSESKRAFALSDGKWVKTEVVPEGFFEGEK